MKSRKCTLKQARGYLLLDSMVGAACLAIILGASLSSLASARSDVSRAGQRVVAAELAQQKLGELMSQEGAAEGDDAPLRFVRRWTVSELSLPGSVTGTWEVVVAVDYRARSGDVVTTTHRAIRRDRPLTPYQ